MKKEVEVLVSLHPNKVDQEVFTTIVEQLMQMNKRDLEVISQVIKAKEKLSDGEFRYLGRHARDNALGKAVRVPSTEFPWVKNAMIHLARATQSVNSYMYDFGNLAPSKQEKLVEITAQFNSVVEASKKITKLSSHKRPNRTPHKPKTLKEAKEVAIIKEKLLVPQPSDQNYRETSLQELSTPETTEV